MICKRERVCRGCGGHKCVEMMKTNSRKMGKLKKRYDYKKRMTTQKENTEKTHKRKKEKHKDRRPDGMNTSM